MHAVHPGRPVLRRSARAGRRLVLFVPATATGCRIGPRHLIEAATEAVAECAPPAAGWKTGAAPWRATVRADLDAARAAASCRKGSRCPRSGTGSGEAGQGLDPVKPVMYLSWTSDVLVMYLPYTCAADTPDITRPRCPFVAAVSEVPGQPADADLA